VNTVAVVDRISGEVLADVAADAALDGWVQEGLERGGLKLMVERAGSWVTLTESTGPAQPGGFGAHGR
jgi:hypothetical protein